jgi:hypothetical protein
MAARFDLLGLDLGLLLLDLLELGGSGLHRVRVVVVRID